MHITGSGKFEWFWFVPILFYSPLNARFFPLTRCRGAIKRLVQRIADNYHAEYAALVGRPHVAMLSASSEHILRTEQYTKGEQAAAEEKC